MIELKRETIEIRGLTITVQEADGRMGTKRSRLMFEAGQAKEAAMKAGEIDEDEWWVRLNIYPPLAAATIEATGSVSPPFSAEDVMTLPDEVVDAWLSAVWRVNPHWLGRPDPTVDLNEKKDASPSRAKPMSESAS